MSFFKTIDEYLKWEKEFNNRYKKIFDPEDKYTITDGIISFDNYIRSNHKILFINREPYEREQFSYSLNNAIYNQICNGEKVWKRQPNLRNRIFENLCIIDIINYQKKNTIVQMRGEDITTYIQNKSEFEKYKLLKNIAYINLKKSFGKSKTYMPDIRKAFLKGEKFILEQIEKIAPDIIFGGNIYDSAISYSNILEWGNNIYLKPGIINIFSIIINGKETPYFDINHPSAWRGKIPVTEYHKEVFEAYKTLLINQK